MTLEVLITWILIGAISGLLANAVVRSVKVSLGGTIIVGILGAFFGGWLLSQLGIFARPGLIGTILKGFVGAVVLLSEESFLRSRACGSAAHRI